MPTAQAPQTAGGPLRVGASLTTKLALELPYPVADEANCRQGGGVGVGSRPQPFVNKKPGKLKADGRNRGQRTEVADERTREWGIAVVTKSLLLCGEDEAKDEDATNEARSGADPTLGGHGQQSSSLSQAISPSASSMPRRKDVGAGPGVAASPTLTPPPCGRSSSHKHAALRETR